MANKTPTIQVRFRAAPQALEAPATVLMVAPIGTGGTGTANTDYKVVSPDDVRTLFGTSEINEAVAAWFEEGLQTEYDLYVRGVSSAGWAAETWEITFSGTATEAGTLVVRFGEYTVQVTIADGDDAAAAATAVVAALEASTAPLASAVDGSVDEQVNITSDYKGLHSRRIPLSIDLYRDRGELGVPGITAAIAAQSTGAGEPTWVAPTEDYSFVFHAFRGTSWLDGVEAYLEAGWEDRNAFGHSLVPVSGSQSSLVTLGTARNDKHASYVDISNAPIIELSAAVRAFAGIAQQIEDQGTPNISGQSMVVPIPPFTVLHDAETLLDAGVTPLRVARTTVSVVRFVASYRENDLGAEDLSQFDLGTIMALAEFGNRLVAMFALNLGKAIVADGQPLSPLVALNAISSAQLEGQLVELLKGLGRDAIVFGATEAELGAVITSVTITEESGRATGFAVQLDPTIVRHVTFLSALVRYL